MNWHLGTMGFSYKEWDGVFYPAGLPQRDYLSYYSQFYDAVEMDSTFYGTPTAEAVKRWAAVTPSHFQFCPKTPRTITHDLRLNNTQTLMGQFLDTMYLLGDKLGPILLQFPPDFTSEERPNLETFFATLPTMLRFAVEFRHTSWHNHKTAEFLSAHQVCWAAADYIHLPKQLHKTADFLYLRFIGPHGQFASKNREMVDKTADLQQWHTQIQPHLPQIADVYSFFNNDYAGYSPATCNRFKQLIGLEVKESRPLQQGRLF